MKIRSSPSHTPPPHALHAGESKEDALNKDANQESSGFMDGVVGFVESGFGRHSENCVLRNKIEMILSTQRGPQKSIA
ncbi:MAG TPA: hypothetical protein VMX35_01055 [Acidobacteriota bacterium]|nr:hypothetical protein [Acidobacteriota bacterium]